jgi:hypothetical protein
VACRGKPIKEEEEEEEEEEAIPNFWKEVVAFETSATFHSVTQCYNAGTRNPATPQPAHCSSSSSFSTRATIKCRHDSVCRWRRNPTQIPSPVDDPKVPTLEHLSSETRPILVILRDTYPTPSLSDYQHPDVGIKRGFCVLHTKPSLSQYASPPAS